MQPLGPVNTTVQNSNTHTISIVYIFVFTSILKNTYRDKGCDVNPREWRDDKRYCKSAVICVGAIYIHWQK